MTKPNMKSKRWTTPELKHLGEIRDVANSVQTPQTQTTQGKS